MLDYTHSSFESISVHQVGNKTNGDALVLADEALELPYLRLHELLNSYFLNAFKADQFYEFTFNNDDLSLNPVYTYARSVFEDGGTCQEQSRNIAKHLYEHSVHPQIKGGDLFVVHFRDMNLQGKHLQALGIFKSENKQDFLKLERNGTQFELESEEGINIEKLDKGCLIFDTEAESGYKVCIVDRVNRSAEAQYWQEDFLSVRPCKDAYHHTQNYLTLTKEFITNRLPEEFEVNKPDQIDLLNRSVDFFKKNEQFAFEDFSREVIRQPDMIDSFNQYKHTFQNERSLELSEDFEISSPAVKKQSRIFKSILKLDRNFHIYIHGDKELIEKGVESDGRKYYKIYYREEQ